MLSKNKRLNLKTDFKWVASGRKLETKYLKLFVRVGNNQTPKVGIAISTKSFKSSTDRNRARRLVAQAFQDAYYKLATNINIVALPKEGVIKVKSDEVLLDLQSVLKNEKIIS